MEESTNREPVQSTQSSSPLQVPQEEQVYQVDYEAPGYEYYRDDRLESVLKSMAYTILVSGIISVIWSFIVFCFVEEPYFVSGASVDDIIKTKTVFKWEGLSIPIAIALSTITSFALLRVIGKMSITLKNIQHRINMGQIVVTKRPHPQRQSSLGENFVSDENSSDSIFKWVGVAMIIIVIVVLILR